MLKTKINTILLCTLFTLFFPLSAGAQYRNPILYADVPDMSVCRAGDYFYMCPGCNMRMKVSLTRISSLSGPSRIVATRGR